MAEFKDIVKAERKAARRASNLLKSAIRSQISKTFTRRTGKMDESTVTPRYDNTGLLDRISLESPVYSFQLHFGSTKKGKQGSTTRKLSYVRDYARVLHGKTQFMAAHRRRGGRVAPMNKNIEYKAYDHIGKAMKSTNALQQLATDIAENRAVNITSQIDF
jgi:hypothetical protein